MEEIKVKKEEKVKGAYISHQSYITIPVTSNDLYKTIAQSNIYPSKRWWTSTPTMETITTMRSWLG